MAEGWSTSAKNHAQRTPEGQLRKGLHSGYIYQYDQILTYLITKFVNKGKIMNYQVIWFNSVN